MILTILYNLTIRPLTLIFEFIFSFMYKFGGGSPLFSLIALSIVVNLLCLPLYRRADAIQEEERIKQDSMKRWVEHIKKTFKGDERYMILTTYYRQQNYKQLSVLKSSISLLLQIPFFIAAFRFLTHLDLLKGASFWFLHNLGAPDHMFQIGSFYINILPIIMTLINVCSAIVYLRGATISQKIQTYGLAVIFLVLLYNSPSGLVFYWTCNQIFSLLKNVFMKLVPNRKVLGICVSLAGIIVALIFIFKGYVNSPKRWVFVIVIVLAAQIPLLMALLKKKKESDGKRFFGKNGLKVYLVGGLFLTLLIGAVIPLSVIASSPVEFVTNFNTPISLIINNVSTAAGFFLVWISVFYYLSSSGGRDFFAFAYVAFSFVATVNFLFFAKGLGFISEYLVYDSQPVFSGTAKILNLLLCVAIVVALYFICKYLYKIMPYVMIVMVMGAVGLIITNGTTTSKVIKDADIKLDTATPIEEAEPLFKLSKNGQNVVVLMMDRFISVFLPYILQEQPQLAEKLDGFVYYPDNLTFGGVTYEALPALVGGYDYMPYNVNARSDELLIDKHCEALKVLPTILSENGFESTIINPGYSGGYFADKSKGTSPRDTIIFDDIENVNAINIVGDYKINYPSAFTDFSKNRQNYNMFFYSVMKSVPLLAQNTIYDEGRYYTTENKEGTTEVFLQTVAELKGLPYFTEVVEDTGRYYMYLENDASHSPTVLDPKTYEPAFVSVNNMLGDRAASVTIDGNTMNFDNELTITHYNADVAALMAVAEWLDYLRENDLYDNTRIILVSDHGTYNEFKADWLQVTDSFNCTRYNSFLMVKDFNSSGTGITVSDKFMTDADVPYLVLEGFVDDPVNPFTGNPLNGEEIKHTDMYVTTKTYPDPRTKLNTATQFPGGAGRWWSVHDSIFDPNNWKRQKNYDTDY